MKYAKLLVAGLFLSLAGNVTLAGMMAGRQHGNAMEPPASLRPIMRLMKDMPPDRQQHVQAIVQPAFDALKEKYRQLSIQRQNIVVLLASPEVNKPQLADAFGRYRSLIDDIQKTSQSAIIDASLLLTQDERKLMVEPRHRHGPKAEVKAETPAAAPEEKQ